MGDQGREEIDLTTSQHVQYSDIQTRQERLHHCIPGGLHMYTFNVALPDQECTQAPSKSDLLPPQDTRPRKLFLFCPVAMDGTGQNYAAPCHTRT